MNAVNNAELEEFRAIVPGEAVEFKDEGETPEGVALGKLTVRSSGLSVFQDARWVTLPEARFIAKYFRVELFEY
jgi:hypothetical protein